MKEPLPPAPSPPGRGSQRGQSFPPPSSPHPLPGGKGVGEAGGLGLLTLLFLSILIASILIAAGLGAVHYTPLEMLAALRHGPHGASPADITLWQLRLPRLALAALVGASLGLAGVAFQSLLRNDLADPYIVGVSSGASVGAEAVLLAGGEAWLGGLAAPLAAFGAALAAMTVVYGLARRGGRVAVTTLLLAGVVVSAFLGAVSSLLLQLGPPGDTAFILGRLFGALPQSPTVWQIGIEAGFLTVGFVVLLMQARAMNVFALGEESAQQLGIETERFKTGLILTGSLLAASTVAVAGIIGFVGLMVPHIARRLARTPDHRRVLPLAAIVGALLLVWADTLARTLLSAPMLVRWLGRDGVELQVGIVTAFLGVPFFCALLRRQGRVR